MFHFKDIFFLIFMCESCKSFNLDTAAPIIYGDPYRSMRIVREKKSYFGYSVIMYPGDNTTKPWIQIGAPRGNDPNLPAFNPGVVFRCPIKESCNLLSIDKDVGEFIYNKSLYIEKKDEAWIGNTMDININHDRIVVCGHRWINYFRLKNDYTMHGICYWSRLHNNNFNKLLPLINPVHYSLGITGRNFYYFANGQSGFSAHISNSKVQPELLLGAPGILNWRGSALIYKNFHERSSIDANVPKIDYKASGLYGYAVSSGYYFDKKELLYVQSAPKIANYLGQIVVFSFLQQLNMYIDERDTKQGSQMGEYFGYSLASGDINLDGYDDLIVGAPCYKHTTYNEGRIHIFYGSKKKSLEINDAMPGIVGKSKAGYFGATISYLGDFDLDGYGDIAVGAPYENENTGAVYIYRGSADGLMLESAQVIYGKQIGHNLKGFGISFSKMTDIDGNNYDDLAVGAYLSGNAIILRAKPVVHLKQSIIIWNKKFSINNTEIEICQWYEGTFLPLNIVVRRKISMDPTLKRVHLQNANFTDTEITLEQLKISCFNYTVIFRANSANLIQPVNIKITQQLKEMNHTNEPFYIDGKKDDKFCKTCPALGTYEPLDIDVPFSLGCGADNVCKADLRFDSKFGNVNDRDQYIIGSSNYIQFDTNVINRGESAYLTQLVIEIPKYVSLRFTPKQCSEKNDSTVLLCTIGNPVLENETKLLSLQLNTNGIKGGDSLSELIFKVSVTTSSENVNTIRTKQFILPLISEADVQVTGKSNQQTYSYGNVTGKSVFSQLYQIQKFGKSPIDKLEIRIHVPTSIETRSGDYVTFVKLISHKGMLAGQPIVCKNLTYIDYTVELDESIDYDDNLAEDNVQIAPIAIDVHHSTTDRMLLRRRRSFDFEDVVYTNNLNRSLYAPMPEAKTTNMNFTGQNKANIECSLIGFKCATIVCQAGPFKQEQHVGVVQIKAVLNVSVLNEHLRKKDIIVLKTSGSVFLDHFNQSGNLPDSVDVASVFLKDIQEEELPLWNIILAVVAGVLLLLLLILGLIKAGFFNRDKKTELEELKKAEVVEEFRRSARLSTERRSMADVEFESSAKTPTEDDVFTYNNVGNK